VKAYFADTWFFLALLDESEARHARASQFAAEQVGRLVTTRWVLVETANAFAAPAFRSTAAAFLLSLEDDPTVRITGDSDELYHRGLLLYSERPDKKWSLTDCISFLVMGDEGLREALTEDRHFAQAGFVPVFAAT